MLGSEVDSDTAFPLLYPEYFNKYQADLSMELTKPVKLGSSSLVVLVKLELGLHGVRQSMHHIVHCSHGTESDFPIHGGFHKERGPRDSCSKENSLIMVKQGLGQIATPNTWGKCRLKIRNVNRSQLQCSPGEETFPAVTFFMSLSNPVVQVA